MNKLAMLLMLLLALPARADIIQDTVDACPAVLYSKTDSVPLWISANKVEEQIAALQSTIAKLEARVKKLEDNCLQRLKVPYLNNGLGMNQCTDSEEQSK